MYPPLKRVAQDDSSLDFLLTTEEAEALFLEGAPGLTKAGYEVLLPASIATVRPGSMEKLMSRTAHEPP